MGNIGQRCGSSTFFPAFVAIRDQSGPQALKSSGLEPIIVFERRCEVIERDGFLRGSVFRVLAFVDWRSLFWLRHPKLDMKFSEIALPHRRRIGEAIVDGVAFTRTAAFVGRSERML